MSGHVALVGAGPGDPALLTRKAVACLRRADLVLYDALVDERVLRLARRAQRFFVGKRAGRHALSQAEIQALLLRAAKRGRQVVRLKGGDPFVFGRGGEEALALQQAGVSFEIVPGVTSAVAVAASAGIPITHRNMASAFLVVSGHDRSTFNNVVAAVHPEAMTVVILMGYARRVSLSADLVNRGWRPDTPAAIIGAGTLPEQQVWRGTLGDLAARAGSVTSDGPALIVVGEVAALDLRSLTQAVLPARADRSSAAESRRSR
jgi:uroporphyrin-III C-methyltransferase